MTGALPEMPRLSPLYTRAAVQAVRSSAWPRRRPGQPADGGARHPAVLGKVSVAGVGLNGERLARYREVCGYGSADTSVPPTYLHVVAFPLHLVLMTAHDFPFRALGLVHVSSSIRQEAALTSADRVDVLVQAQDVRPHRRGRQFTLVTQARVSGEVVWWESCVFLARAPSTAGTGRSREDPVTAAADGGTGTVTFTPPPWRLPSDLGRRYAAVSGDRNPIHLFDLTARLFGFRRHIAHGMWTTARALAELSDRLPERFCADVVFRRPLPLPSTVQLTACDTSPALSFQVATARGEGIPAGQPGTHLTGTVTRR
jgi:acyl dehydratase